MTAIPAAFHINNLLELRTEFSRELSDGKESFDVLRKKRSNTISMENSSMTHMMCLQHNDPLKVYCETCNKVICKDCTFDEHKKHDFELISKCYPKHHQNIEKKLGLVKEDMADMDEVIQSLDRRESEVVEQANRVTKEIQAHAEYIIHLVQKSEQEMISHVEWVKKEKQQHLLKQKKMAKGILHRLKYCEAIIQQNLNEMSQEQVVKQMDSMLNHMSEATEDVVPSFFVPIEQANISFTLGMNIEKGIGQITSNNCARAVIDPPTMFVKGKKLVAEVTFQSHDGAPYVPPPSLVSCECSSPGFSQPIECEVTQTMMKNKYRITFTSHHSGYMLQVRVGGVEVAGSRYLLPYSPVKAVGVNNDSYNIAVTDEGNIVLAEKDVHSVMVMNKEGARPKSVRLKRKKEVQLTLPHGVAITDKGHMLVTDSHRLYELSMDGGPIRSYGGSEWGNNQSSFNYPSGIAVHPTTRQIFVADQSNNRVQVLNDDFTFSHSIRSLPDDKRFKKPYDVALDDEGYLYVAEGSNHCITKLTTAGQYIMRFGSYGSDPGQLNTPSSLVIGGSFVYVVEWGNHRVSIFNTEGRFLQCIGSEPRSFNHPWGVAIDRLGNLYISDTGNKRIVVY